MTPISSEMFPLLPDVLLLIGLHVLAGAGISLVITVTVALVTAPRRA